MSSVSKNLLSEEKSNNNLNNNREINDNPLIAVVYRKNSSASSSSVSPTDSKFQKISKTKFSVIRRSLSSNYSDNNNRNIEDNNNKGDFGIQQNNSSLLPSIDKYRRSSFYLDSEDLDQNKRICPSNFNMDPSCNIVVNTEKSSCFRLLPCIIAFVAVILIAIPTVKILGGVKRDITNIQHVMADLKKQMGYVDEESDIPETQLSKEYNAAIKHIVKEELVNFDSDKTGRTDFALETAGGRIMNVIDTINYGPTISFLGITLCDGNNGPRAMIQASSATGECWAFKGSKGAVLIKLLGKICINAVSLEHISKKISPTGRIDTAPKEFSIYGVQSTNGQRIILGKFEYKLDSTPIQYFPIKPCDDEPIEFIEFHVHSNHGNPDYTCVYRLRVHGTLESL